MSELTNITAEIVEERAAWTTDPVINLRTGATFHAEIDGSPDAVLVMSELGEDAREVVLLHVYSDIEAAGILKNDSVRFTLFGLTTTHVIIKRRNDSSSPFNDFWARQKTDKDQ